MNQFIFCTFLVIQVISIKSQVILSGITESGISLGNRWQKTFIGKFLNPHRYTLGTFAFDEQGFTLQSNLFTFPPLQDVFEQSAFDLISVANVEYILLAHGKYLYLLKIQNNQIQLLHQYLLASSEQSYSTVQVVHIAQKSYLFVLNTSSRQVHIYQFIEEALHPEPRSPYDLHEQGINQLLAIKDGMNVYLLITNHILNTIRTYAFQNGRLQEQPGSPINTSESAPVAILPIRQNNKTYICVANNMSHSVSIYSFLDGTLTEQSESPFALPQDAFPTSLLTSISNDRIYLLVSNSGTKRISVFTFDEGRLSPKSTIPVEFRLNAPALNLNMSLIEHAGTNYISVYNARGGNNINLFRFNDGIMTCISIIKNTLMRVRNMQAPTQVMIAQTLLQARPKLPEDIAELIARYTTFEKGQSSYPLQKKQLIDAFVRLQSFKVSRVLELIKAMNIVTPESNKFKILFNDFILPYYVQYHDMRPVQEWLTSIRTQKSVKTILIQNAITNVNQQIQQTSLLLHPWLTFKLYWLRIRLDNALKG